MSRYTDEYGRSPNPRRGAPPPRRETSYDSESLPPSDEDGYEHPVMYRGHSTATSYHSRGGVGGDAMSRSAGRRYVADDIDDRRGAVPPPRDAQRNYGSRRVPPPRDHHDDDIVTTDDDDDGYGTGGDVHVVRAAGVQGASVAQLLSELEILQRDTRELLQQAYDRSDRTPPRSRDGEDPLTFHVFPSESPAASKTPRAIAVGAQPVVQQETTSTTTTTTTTTAQQQQQTPVRGGIPPPPPATGQQQPTQQTAVSPQQPGAIPPPPPPGQQQQPANGQPKWVAASPSARTTVYVENPSNPEQPASSPSRLPQNREPTAQTVATTTTSEQRRTTTVEQSNERYDRAAPATTRAPPQPQGANTAAETRTTTTTTSAYESSPASPIPAGGAQTTLRVRDAHGNEHYMKVRIPVLECVSTWRQKRTADGRVFWKNEATGEKSWTLPE